MSQQPITQAATSGLSRRHAMFAGAGVIAGSAAALAASRLTSSQDQTATAASATGTGTGTKLNVPVMIQVADAGTGAFDLYVGSEVYRLVNTQFAGQVATAARKATK